MIHASMDGTPNGSLKHYWLSIDDHPSLLLYHRGQNPSSCKAMAQKHLRHLKDAQYY